MEENVQAKQEVLDIRALGRADEILNCDVYVWNSMKGVSINNAVFRWLISINNPRTKKNYQSAFERLVFLGIIDPQAPITSISTEEIHNHILMEIAKISGISEATKQARSAAYISFTKYLARKFPRNFDRAYPNTDKNNPTFGKVSEKASTHHMTYDQWTRFLKQLQQINPRDCLIAKLALQGGKRACEVLSLETDQINWNDNVITYIVSKTGKCKKERFITYPDSIMRQLSEYLGNRTGVVFVTRKGNPVPMNQIQNTFAKAGEIVGIPFKVTPHVLRASCVTFLRQQGFKDCDILKVTGHSRAEMINYYDKTSLKKNPTQEVALVM